MTEFAERICAIDGKQLPVSGLVQSGYYCCGEYYCSKACLDKSFEGTGETWEQHYSEAGDCYYTEWEVEVN
jgi:hypothetical protein